MTDTVDRADEISVGHSLCGLLELPQIFTQTCNCCRGVEDDFGSIETQGPRAFGKVAIVADVDSDICELGLEDRIAEVAGFEIKLFPETRRTMRDVVLPIFAEILAIGIDNRRSVVVNTFEVFFVNRNDDGHAVLLGDLLEQPGGGAVGDLLGGVVPLGLLLGAEVGRVEHLLQAQHLHAGLGFSIASRLIFSSGSSAGVEHAA